jgi:superfamily II DNA or RNA helicase
MTNDSESKNVSKNQIIDENKLDKILKSNSLNTVIEKNKKKKMEELCIRKKFKLQPSQKFLGEFFKKSNLKGLLIYHKIGAGKTCTAITIAEKMKRNLGIIIVLPAALINSFRGELRSECPGDEYISQDNRKRLNKLNPTDEDYLKIIKKSNNKIDKVYKIYSYHKFSMLVNENKIKFKNNLVIIDEIQNMISESGTFYKNIKNTIMKSDENTRILLLSATPIFDKPQEIALLLNLLKPDNPLPTGNLFNSNFLKAITNKDGVRYNVKNIELFKDYIHGMVSYYRGAPPQTFPQENFKVIRCQMSEFQYKSYLSATYSENNMVRGAFRNVDILNLPTNFFIGPRMLSNIAFPNKSIGENGYRSLTKEAMMIQNIREYSTKFYQIYKRIKQSKGPVFIYSNFKELGGIRTLIKFLQRHGYKDYKIHGESEMSFALWTGDEPLNYKDEIKTIFNKKENFNGSKIKIFLGTPSIKEGVSLLRVEQVHILEPYWNISRLKQIMGRAVRYCSHKDLPNKRRFVDIYLYLATYPHVTTVDQYIWSLAKKKYKIISKFENSLKEKAIDCEIFYEANVYDNEEELKCNSGLFPTEDD